MPLPTRQTRRDCQTKSPKLNDKLAEIVRHQQSFHSPEGLLCPVEGVPFPVFYDHDFKTESGQGYLISLKIGQVFSYIKKS